MDKQYLLNKFNVLKGNIDNCNNCNRCDNCYNCNNCYCCNSCNSCNSCYNCDNCNNCNSCYNCLLCKGLSYKYQGYWLLNEEVTKEEFEQAKNVLMG